MSRIRHLGMFVGLVAAVFCVSSWAQEDAANPRGQLRINVDMIDLEYLREVVQADTPSQTMRLTLDDCVRALMGPMGETTGMDGSVYRLGEGRWVMAGRLDLRAVREEVGCELPPSRDYVTVAGFVMAKLGHIPLPGESVEFAAMRLTVLEMTGQRIDTLLVRRRDLEQEVPT